MANFTLHCGAMTMPFEEQLKAQGFGVKDITALGHLQSDADALTRLAVRRVLPDSVVNKARRKITDRVAAMVYEQNHNE